MDKPKVRAVVTSRWGFQERTDWYPDGSPEATAALEAIVRQQTGDFAVTWEYWDDGIGANERTDAPHVPCDGSNRQAPHRRSE